MESYYPVRIKRKELHDEFSDFSLSSPDAKIRRLDVELPPRIEEQELDIPMIISQSEPLIENNGNVGRGRGDSVLIEELESSLPVNEERAIVLFNPTDTPFLHSPSPCSFAVSPNFISGLKNQVLWSSSQSNLPKTVDSETEKKDDNNGCLAVVPWMPTHSHHATTQKSEGDETGVESMDVDENYIGDVDQRAGNESVRMSMNRGLIPWPQVPQQHCITPHVASTC